MWSEHCEHYYNSPTWETIWLLHCEFLISRGDWDRIAGEVCAHVHTKLVNLDRLILIAIQRFRLMNFLIKWLKILDLASSRGELV